MNTLALDEGTADRLLAGVIDAGDAPPEYRAVATTLQALRKPPDPTELEGCSAAVEDLAAAVVVRRRPSRDRRRRRRRTRSRVGALIAAAAAALAVGSTSGLAVAGALPRPAQGVASTVLGTVGISIPTGDTQQPAGAPTTSLEHSPTPASTPAQPAANGTDAPAPAPAEGTPPATAPAGPNNGGNRGVPHGDANPGAGHAPNVPPGQTNPRSRRP